MDGWKNIILLLVCTEGEQMEHLMVFLVCTEGEEMEECSVIAYVY